MAFITKDRFKQIYNEMPDDMKAKVNAKQLAESLLNKGHKLEGYSPTPQIGASLSKTEAKVDVPEKAIVQPPVPRVPVEINIEEIQRTGKLPEGVTQEMVNEAIKQQKIERGEVLEERPITVGQRLREAGTRFKEFVEEVPPQGKAVTALAAGAGAGALVSGALKAIPVVAKLAQSGGLTQILTRAGIGAAEAEAATATFTAIEEGRLPTEEETTAALSIGAALPVVGIIGAGSKKLLGKAIPESLVKSAIRLKPTEKIKIAQKLEQMGIQETAETAEQYLIRERITGTPKQMGDKLLKNSKAARIEKLETLKGLTNKFKDEKVLQFADETLSTVKGISGLEKESKKIEGIINSLKSKEGATLAQIDELKTISDKTTNVFTIAGNVREAAKAKGMANLRGYTQGFIENEAEKLGVSNIKKLNQDISLTRALGDAIKKQEIGAGGNALTSLSDLIVGTGAVGLGAGLTEGDLLKKLKTGAIAGITAVLGAKLLSPANRVKFANLLTEKLSIGEAGKFLNLLQGKSSKISGTISDKIRSAAEAAVTQ